MNHYYILPESNCFAGEATPQTPAELLGSIDELQTRFSKDAFADFVEATEEYVAAIPGNVPSDTHDQASEAVKIETAHLSATWCDKLRKGTKEAIDGLPMLSVGITRQIEQEFEACYAAKDDPLRQPVIDELEKVKEDAEIWLKNKQAVYEELMVYFAGNTGLAAEELTVRMSDRLREGHEIIRASEDMPKLPRFPSFASRREHYKAWENNKKDMLGRFATSLLGREELLEEYYRSADASYRRTLYGSREMILNRGFNSDSIDEIDTYQRRHYTKNEKYRIALSPSEWAEKFVRMHIFEILYSEGSDTAKYLDDVALSNGEESYCNTSRQGRKSAYERRFKDDSDLGSFAEPSATSGGGEYLQDQYDRYNFDEQQLGLFDDMRLVIDAHLIGATHEQRDKIMHVCAKRVSTNPASTQQKILNQMMATMHPDRPGGNKELSRLVNALSTSYRKSTSRSSNKA